MSETPLEATRAVWTTEQLDAQDIRAAQRLAALDPDIRQAMMEVWWIALRAGVTAAQGPTLDLPVCPFQSSVMEAAKLSPWDV